ncbi:hypothetical protein E8L90_13275 [Brevibacillus antibioticus]|uniref:Uncharacterized protein n=1 Tax=Brevibacillus antibioticus TaxID=2570228 RepID=A0A4U2Y827_9BACL|nr:hypothetical protein [Brevibacillus antibioticus]TKI56355.1 hypothetical protein E8L90_13275 [Brevibacillus antibioticus]
MAIIDMWRDKFGVFTIWEKVGGAFNWRYRQSEERVTGNRVNIVDVSEITNVRSHLLSLQKNGQLNIVYSHWIPTEFELFNLIKPWYNDAREKQEDAIAFGETLYPNSRKHFS